MIYPSIEEITKGKYNRYTLCIATAKCARIVTEEYVEQREIAEKMLANKETDKSLASMIKREIRDEKAVKTAIKRLYNGDFAIKESEEPIVDPAEAFKKKEISILGSSFLHDDDENEEKDEFDESFEEDEEDVRISAEEPEEL